jgi:hypothetical protein
MSPQEPSPPQSVTVDPRANPRRMRWPLLAIAAFLLLKAVSGYFVRERAATRRREALMQAAREQHPGAVDRAHMQGLVADEIARARANGTPISADEAAAAAYNAYARDHGLAPATLNGGGFVIRSRPVSTQR